MILRYVCAVHAITAETAERRETDSIFKKKIFFEKKNVRRGRVFVMFEGKKNKIIITVEQTNGAVLLSFRIINVSAY